jgi:hypothetical protein
LDDGEVIKAGESLVTVKELIRRKDYQEIKGIDKRMAMLDAKLLELEMVYKKLKDNSMKLLHAQADQNNFRVSEF